MEFFLGKPKPERDALPAVIPPATVESESKYLKSVLTESRQILDADLASFELVTQQPGWSVYSRPVQGTKLTMARLDAEVPMEPDRLYQLLLSMDGKCIIDPFPRERHSEPVQNLRLPDGEARIVYSEAPRFAGMLRPREYVTCDAAAKKERLFVCKSVCVPGGPLAVAQKGHVRANLLFAMRMRERRGRPGCTHLQMVNWLDLGGNTVPDWVANLVTERWYFQALMRRFNAFTAKHGLIPSSAAAKQDRR